MVLGTAWAAPLVGRLLALLGAQVIRVDDPRRDDPFPLAGRLAEGTQRTTPDLTTAAGRDALTALLARADLLVDGYTPRVLANAGLADDVLARDFPHLARLRIAAFADSDRPGYGLAAECRGGWAARTDPPQLGRSSVADPVAGCLGALHAVARLDAGGGYARLSLEEAVGHLLARERIA
ncbi:MAG: CoA transferase [Acidimicrobiia bacterium]